MRKSVNAMLQELRDNNLTTLAVGCDSICESYKGLRQETFCIVSSRDEFLEDQYNSLAIVEDGKLLEDNINAAYSLMLLQNITLPYIL